MIITRLLHVTFSHHLLAFLRRFLVLVDFKNEVRDGTSVTNKRVLRWGR